METLAFQMLSPINAFALFSATLFRSIAYQSVSDRHFPVIPPDNLNVRFPYRSSTREQSILCSDRERFQRAFFGTSQTISLYILAITQRKFEHLDDTLARSLSETSEPRDQEIGSRAQMIRRGGDASIKQGSIQEVDEYQGV